MQDSINGEPHGTFRLGQLTQGNASSTVGVEEIQGAERGSQDGSDPRFHSKGGAGHALSVNCSSNGISIT